MAKLITQNQTGFFEEKYIEPKNGKDFKLKELQGFVQGYIEVVPIDKDTIAVVNEEGLINELPYNSMASLIAGQPLFGNVLICRTEQVK